MGDEKKNTIVLAAGGTGGHLFPAEALAQELLARGQRVIIITDRRGEAFQSLKDRVSIHVISAGGLSLRGLLKLLRGLWESLKILHQDRPDLVVGFGGYPSFAPVLMAQLLFIKTLLHEQNTRLGQANKVLACAAKKIALSFPVAGLSARVKKKTVLTGNPVRPPIAALLDRLYKPPEKDGPFYLLVTGGSQGAAVFSKVVPAAVELLPESFKGRLHIFHQARPEDLEETKKAYAGVSADVRSFFKDMAECLGKAHLFIGRCGASTVAEIATAGCPALFVPYPGHKDRQQESNARILTDRDGGWLVLEENFTPDFLAAKLQEVMENTGILATCAQNTRTPTHAEAVKSLADLAESLLYKA